jgi:hypothetical protein
LGYGPDNPAYYFNYYGSLGVTRLKESFGQQYSKERPKESKRIVTPAPLDDTQKWWAGWFATHTSEQHRELIEGLEAGRKERATPAPDTYKCEECDRITQEYNTCVANGLIVKAQNLARVLVAHISGGPHPNSYGDRKNDVL